MPKATKSSPAKGTKSGKVTKPAKKAKKEKDPNAPKRGQTAYFLWLADNREALKKANPDAKVTEISKLAGVAWNKASAGEKSKYEAAAAKDKERYTKEMLAYKGE